MSDTQNDTILAALRTRQRDLELDACAVRARVEEVAELIALLEGSQRRRPGRPRNAPAANTYPLPLQMPQRVEGGIAGAGTDPPEAAA